MAPLPIPVNSDIGASGAGAPDTSAPAASTPTGPDVPVDTSAVQPAPDVQAPPSDAASVGAATGAPAPPDAASVWGDAQPAAATLAKQGRLASMLRGLLMGVESGRSPVGAAIQGVTGAAMGLAAPNETSQLFE